MSSHPVAKTVVDALVTAAAKWSQDVPGVLRYHWQHGAGHVDAMTAAPGGQMLCHPNWHHADGVGP